MAVYHLKLGKLLMDLNEVISIIEHPQMSFQADRDTVRLPWDVTPSEYLRFAQEDLEGNDRRSAVNALSNAKRALECQVDSLMLVFEMEDTSSKWHFPKKIEALERIGIIAPRILTKINRHRNEMEHDYCCPSIDVVVDFVDVVGLFIEATRIHIVDRRRAWEFDLGDGYGAWAELCNRRIRVGHGRRHTVGAIEDFTVNAGSEEFFRLLSTIGRETEWQSSGLFDWRAS